ncbi:MAG TPA: transglycosylase SLT domain-containing protein [Pyrinomonadaceae bacterium]|nr:transglycosylase SLT domain-containing protein [Pyrinomonadaceae bacterium]
MKTFLAALIATVFLFSSAFGQTSDAALRRAMRLDDDQRDSGGKLPTLDAAEHLSRAETYMANRLFPQAREHWQIVFDNFPDDPGIPKALFGTARSYMWERQYEKAVFWFEKLNGNTSKDGREGLAFKGASLVRLGKNVEAAKVYEQYVQQFPQGERIESAHLNLIDAYREGRKYEDAERWIDRTISRFAGKPAEVNALHARLRMEIYRERWNEAIAAADQLLAGKSFSGAMAGGDEIKFLRALALEKAGRKQHAMDAYAAIPDSFSSYYGGLAAARLAKNGSKSNSLVTPTAQQSSDSPIMYRSELLQSARKFDVDPRFLLAIMKQESSFKAAAKSPAGARGLLQLVYDTAIKYKSKAGYPNLQPDQLYSPSANIAIGAAYIADLKSQFGGLYEAIAASYNGGEDNAARWLDRSKPKEPGIFASEVGFAESKAYVFKVMNNYRIYRELYTEDLQRR